MTAQNPRVVDIKSSTAKTYTIRLEGCEARPAPYSKKTYRPTMATVIKRDGNVSKVELTGPNIKKDGTDSEMRTRETFYSYSKQPAWLESILGGLA